MDSAAFLNFFNIFLASIQLLPLKAFVCMLHPKKKKPTVLNAIDMYPFCANFKSTKVDFL